MDKISVLIVDDHRLFREGMKLLLGNLPGIGEIFEAESGEDFLALLKQGLNPGIVFMDINMQGINGIEATRSALLLYPDLRIIALSMYSDEAYYTKMIEAGVKGFILKNSGIREVEAAVSQVSAGFNYVSQEILSSLMKNINRASEPARTFALSEREEKVLVHICKGLSNQEIADLLHISKRTVDKHRENILLKTDSRNTAGLVIYAIKNGILVI
jgi:DNA-binding NarL/FixJ family response regulator